MEKNNQIQLVVNRPESDETTIDLGRVFHNMKVKSRIFAWVLVLCLVVGICAPLLLYQLQKPRLTVTSVVTLRYEVDGKTVSTLVTPTGAPMDLSVVSSAPVVQKALDGLTLSKPVTIENIRNNLTVTRVLTEESSRNREILNGLSEAKNAEVYERLENTELEYQNRFIVSLSNGFGDEESRVKYDLKDEELRLLLNRILDAFNDTLVRQYADVRLPEDRISLIDTESMDIPEILDNLDTALTSLYTYCEEKSDSIRAYRSWQTGLTLDNWMSTIEMLRNISVDYLSADVYARGLMRNRESVSLIFRYRIRTLQNELDKLNETIANTDALLSSYRNNDVYVSMQESDSARTTTMTTAYYNSLVAQQQKNYASAAALRTQIAETQINLDRMEGVTSAGDLAVTEAELAASLDLLRTLQDGIRAHMTELFTSPLYTTYSEHSAPMGKQQSFLTASAKKMIIGAAAGAVIACGLWFLAALAPEFRHDRKENPTPDARNTGKEAAEA